MVNDATILLRAKQRYPNPYLLARIVSQRAKQLSARETNSRPVPSLIHQALEEAAAGDLRFEREPSRLRVKDAASGPTTDSVEVGESYAPM